MSSDRSTRRPGWIEDAERLDLAIYAGVARTPTPVRHSAGAFAFATGVAHGSPAAGVPLRALAAVVAYSRVHTGVHYPADVLAGALIGTVVAQVTTHAIDSLPFGPGTPARG